MEEWFSPSSHTSQPRPQAPSAGFSQLSSTNLTSCLRVSMPSTSKLLRYSSCGFPGSGFRTTWQNRNEPSGRHSFSFFRLYALAVTGASSWVLWLTLQQQSIDCAVAYDRSENSALLVAACMYLHLGVLLEAIGILSVSAIIWPY